MEIFADADYQGLGAQTGGRVVTPPHRTFKENAPDWCEEMHERQRKGTVMAELLAGSQAFVAAAGHHRDRRSWTATWHPGEDIRSTVRPGLGSAASLRRTLPERRGCAGWSRKRVWSGSRRRPDRLAPHHPWPRCP